jgi:hypothetical protein
MVVDVYTYAQRMRHVPLPPSALSGILETLQKWGFRSFIDRKPELFTIDTLWTGWCDPASTLLADPMQFDADRIEDDRDLAFHFHTEIRSLVAGILVEFVDQSRHVFRTLTQVPRIAIDLFRDFWTAPVPVMTGGRLEWWTQYVERSVSFWDGLVGHEATETLRTLEAWYGLVLRETVWFIFLAEERLRPYDAWRLQPRTERECATVAVPWCGYLADDAHTTDAEKIENWLF